MGSEEQDLEAMSKAATTVITTLQPLSPDARARVLESAAALYGVQWKKTGNKGAVDEQGSDEGRGDGKRLSVVELLNAKNPATNSQRIAVFAHYHETVAGKERFARADLEQYFAMAKLAKPQNYDRDFKLAVGEGWIHEDGDQSYLTNTGTTAVEEGFGGKGKPRGSAVRKKKASKAPPAGGSSD